MSDIMFSVAVITYNQEKNISQTLDSILNQEHDYKYEIVVGEDCSTDNTKKIIEEYVEKYPDIIKPLYNNPNKGLINNYFNVINHCQGKYIMECAGDDYWLPGKVKSQIEFMENNPDVGMCYGKARVWNEKIQKFEKKLFGSNRESFEFLLTNGNDIPAPTVCLRSNIVKNYICEIKPQEKNWLMEDYPMWLYFSHESTMRFIDEVTATYRLLENSTSHSDDVEKYIKFEESVLSIKRYFNDKYKLSFKFEINYQCIIYVFFNRLLNNYNKKNAKDFRKICKRKIFSLRNLICYICSLSKFSCIILKILLRIKEIIKNNLLASFLRIFNFDSLVKEFKGKISKFSNIYLSTQLQKYDTYKTQNKKTILLVTHELSLTGAPIALFNFANRLKLLGYLPVIISPVDGQLTELFLNNGIPVIIFPEIYTTNIINKIEPLFDLIIVNTIITYPIIKKLNNKSKPVIWWIHESSIVYSLITKLLLPWKLTKNIHIYSVGNHPKYVLHKVRSRYTINELLYFIPEAISNSNILNIKDNSRKFVKFAIIGTFAIHKGQDIVIEAIEKLPDEIRKKIVLYFVGNIFDKSIYAKIEELVSKYPSNIVNLGVLTQKEIRTLYQNIDCLICSSREDSMPVVVTEAMMYSNLIICSENAGSAELIKQYNSGFVFQNNNSLELSELLTFVVQNLAKLDEIRKNARRTYDEIFSQEAFDRKIQKIINDIM